MARPQSKKPTKPQFSIAIPIYVLTQLRALAVREDCSLRCIVLRALPSLGIHVKPEDITADRRKGRPGGSRTHYARGNRTEGGQV